MDVLLFNTHYVAGHGWFAHGLVGWTVRAKI